MFFEGRNVPLFDFLDTLSLSFIYKNERRQRCHDQKNNSKREFSNRTYLYEVEDGIDFFDAVRKASAEFVNTPGIRPVYCGVQMVIFRVICVGKSGFSVVSVWFWEILLSWCYHCIFYQQIFYFLI